MKKEVKNKKKNTMAFTGFILGIASIFLSSIGIIPILGMVFSAIGIDQTRKRKEEGEVFATIGLILSIIYFFSYLYQYGYI